MIVLDCCAAVALILGTSEGKSLEALMERDEEIISSSLLLAELASALRKYVKAGAMAPERATWSIRELGSLVDRFVDVSENHVESFCEALRLDHSPYDLFYFTLARRNGATLCTLDHSLMRLCEREGVDCIHELLPA
ncbi:MAG: type II toxin-antitoxin system VapC family toxin [Coriobacteriales bacterium]|jgi:predicted nucleic acid-binding protein|nr:type II toxin-antitoxin system VapC family toxin [Coriobacteriales bacterium]